MSQTKIITGAAFQIDYAADYVKQKYEADGYQAQKLSFTDNGTEGVLVQIRNTSDGVGGILKTAIGCKTCATLKMLKQGNDLEIEVMAGSWLDKGVVITISMFVLWPLLLTGGFGAYRQKKLLNQLFIDTLGFFAGSN